MLPFSKRPPPPEEYFLLSGEFEVVLPIRASASQERTLPAPLPPRSAFARHAAPSPYGYNDLAAPPPPHSLTPVAMISERTGQGPASTARRGPTFRFGEKPSLKWGVMIAVSGALLGGVLGLGMDATRQREHTAAASESTETADRAAVATALPAQAPIMLAPIVLAPPALIVAPEKSGKPGKADKPAQPERTAKVAPPPKHRSFVAAKVPASKPPPAEKAQNAEKPESGPKPVAKPEKAPKAGSSDARKVLEDAIKDTTNTL